MISISFMSSLLIYLRNLDYVIPNIKYQLLTFQKNSPLTPLIPSVNMDHTYKNGHNKKWDAHILLVLSEIISNVAYKRIIILHRQLISSSATVALTVKNEFLPRKDEELISK